MLDKRIGLWTTAALCGIALRALAADAPPQLEPGTQPADANHYVMQCIVRGGRIVLMREFGSPVRTTAAAAQ